MMQNQEKTLLTILDASIGKIDVLNKVVDKVASLIAPRLTAKADRYCGSVCSGNCGGTLKYYYIYGASNSCSFDTYRVFKGCGC